LLLYTGNELNYLPIDEDEKIEFNKFVKNKFPQSKTLYFFSGINKVYTKGICTCGKKIRDCKFNDFFNVELSLNNKISKANFKKIIKDNFKEKKHKIICMNCNQRIVEIKVEYKFIKVGDILIFSLGNNTNNINLDIDYIIDLKDFMDEALINTNSFKYELFAIYSESKVKDDIIIRKCKIKINGIFYEIIDDDYDKLNNDQSEKLCNLFYKKIK